MSEALAKPCLETQGGEKLQEENEPGVGGERLAFELQLGDGVSLTANVGSAKLHAADLLVVCVLSSTYIYTRGKTQGSPFLIIVPLLCL